MGSHFIAEGQECCRAGGRLGQHRPAYRRPASSIDPKTARPKEVADAYHKYGVPMIQSYAQDPTSIGNALLNLATQLLRSKLPADKATLPTNILNTAVQLTVTAMKAD